MGVRTYGQAKRTWVMDRGIPSEAILKEMREPERETFYLVGAPGKNQSAREEVAGSAVAEGTRLGASSAIPESWRHPGGPTCFVPRARDTRGRKRRSGNVRGSATSARRA
jgi:hypothetical protein